MNARKSNSQSVIGLIAAGAILLGAVPLVFPEVASAQMVRFQTDMRPSDREGRIGESDITSLVHTLTLDADQEAIVRALYEGYRSAWDDAAREHQAAVGALFEGAKNSGEHREVARKMLGVQKQWQATRDHIESEFIESVRGIVTTDQLADWPRFERDRRRHSLQARHSTLGGEGVDLIDISESLDLSDEAMSRLEPVSSVYAEELDLAMADRARAFVLLEKQTTPAEGEDFGALDPEVVKKAQDKLHEKHTAVRDVNERYATLFSGQLSEVDAHNFMALYRERSFPGVYRPTAVDRYIKQVRALETLNEEQVRTLDLIDRDYQRQVGMINDQLVVLIRQDEAKLQDPGMFFGGGPTGGEGGFSFAVGSQQASGGGGEVAVGLLVATTTTQSSDGGPPAGSQRHQIRAVQPAEPLVVTSGGEAAGESPQGKLKKSKSDLVDRTIDAVAALLSPEQLTLAPKPDEMARLGPEEQMRRMVERALQNAVFTTGEGDEGITITIGGDK